MPARASEDKERSMNRIGAGAVRGLVLACLMATGTAVQAADRIQGTFGLDDHKETLAHGLAWVDAKGEVSVGFFTVDLVDPKDQARAMKGEGAIYGPFDKANVTLTLHLKSGAARAALTSFESCNITFMGFALGPFTWNASLGKCGPVELSGGLKPGSLIHGRFKGQGEALPRDNGHKPVYTWDLEFTATLRAKP